jgi:hypothetical protein
MQRQKRQGGALDEISKHHSRPRGADRDRGVLIIAEEHHKGGYETAPPCVVEMSAMASAVIQSITVEGQNLPSYSS